MTVTDLTPRQAYRDLIREGWDPVDAAQRSGFKRRGAQPARPEPTVPKTVVLHASAVIWPDDPWWKHAACHGKDVNLFYPSKGENARPAKRICAICPVQAECLDDAVKTREPWGVRGGLTERERRRAKGGHQLGRAIQREQSQTRKDGAA